MLRIGTPLATSDIAGLYRYGMRPTKVAELICSLHLRAFLSSSRDAPDEHRADLNEGDRCCRAVGAGARQLRDCGKMRALKQ